jgi:hypothetical protein
MMRSRDMPRPHFVFLSLLLVGCSTQAPNPVDSHVRLSEENRQMMRRMELLVFERELTDQKISERRRRQAEQLVANTDELVDSILKESNSADFNRFAITLRGQALAIERFSAAGDPSLSEATKNYRQTCMNCHQHFRGQ